MLVWGRFGIVRAGLMMECQYMCNIPYLWVSKWCTCALTIIWWVLRIFRIRLSYETIPEVHLFGRVGLLSSVKSLLSTVLNFFGRVCLLLFVRSSVRAISNFLAEFVCFPLLNTWQVRYPFFSTRFIWFPPCLLYGTSLWSWRRWRRLSYFLL